MTSSGVKTSISSRRGFAQRLDAQRRVDVSGGLEPESVAPLRRQPEAATKSATALDVATG